MNDIFFCFCTINCTLHMNNKGSSSMLSVIILIIHLESRDSLRCICSNSFIWSSHVEFWLFNFYVVFMNAKPTYHLTSVNLLSAKMTGQIALAQSTAPQCTEGETQASRYVLFFFVASLDNQNTHHVHCLQTTYCILTGSCFSCKRFGSHWEEIGFQGEMQIIWFCFELCIILCTDLWVFNDVN